MQIELNDVNKTIRKKQLLVNINLKMESGQVYGFVGDNGSGKTVLFKVLLGLMEKTTGSIRIDGKEQKDLLQDVGFIIERPNYIPYYTARKNLKILASYRKKADDQRIDEVLTMFGLDPDDRKKVGKYSLGMKQILEEKKQGKLILIASHYTEDIHALCDVVYRMEHGKIAVNPYLSR